MTDSIDRKPGDSKKLPKPDFSKFKNPAEAKEFEELPTWVRSAVAMKYLQGISWAEVARRHGKSAGTLDHYKKSPAIKRWRDELQEAANDPKTVAEMMLKASALGVTLDYLAAYEKAIEANDFKEVGAMSRDLLDRIGITKKDTKRKNEAAKLTIVLGGGDVAAGALQVPSIEATWEEVEDEDDAEEAEE